MAYGLKVKNAAGVTTYDSTTVTWLQIGYLNAPASVTTTQTFTDANQFSEVMAQQWFINTPPEDQEAYAHNVVFSNSNNTVTISGGNQTQGVLILGR